MTQNIGSMITFRRPDGKDVQGYLAKPQKLEGAPAIVVIQEWWGVNDQIRGVADRLAECGYVALVPDLYRGKATVEEEEANHLMSGLDFGDAASQDIRGAVQYLKTHSERVGITGYCMGGALTPAGAQPDSRVGRWRGLVWFPADRVYRREQDQGAGDGVTGPRRTRSLQSKRSMCWRKSCSTQTSMSSFIATRRTMRLRMRPLSGRAVSPEPSSMRCGHNLHGTGR